MGSDLDSTFDFGSADGNDCTENNFSDDNEDILNSDDAVSSYEASSDGEVWKDVESSDEHLRTQSSDEVCDTVERSESSDEESDTVEKNGLVIEVVVGISFFLTYFHLLYHLSEIAIRTLLSFFRQLIHFLAIITGHDLLLQIMNCIPKSMNTIRNIFPKNSFIEYVVCSKCNKLYLPNDCIVNNNGYLESLKCSYVEFPNHPLSSKRGACGEELLKRVKLGKKMKLVARKTYNYHSTIESLKTLANQIDFLTKCDMWRSRSKEFSLNLMGHIFDGKLWNDLMFIDGRPFLSIPNNLVVTIDWFRVYEH